MHGWGRGGAHESGSHQMPRCVPAAVQLASAPVQTLSETDAAQLEAAQRKLQEYVLQHTEQATMSGSRAAIPFARVVDFQQPAEGGK